MEINACLGNIPLATLTLYAHLIPALAILILGVFAYYMGDRQTKTRAFFAFTVTFSLWLLLDLANWTSHDHRLVAATWAPLDLVNIVFTLFAGLFVLSVAYPNRIPRIYSYFALLALIVPFVLTVTGNAVYQMDLAQCEMVGNEFLALYKLAVELVVGAAILVLAIKRYLETGLALPETKRLVLITTVVLLFMAVFAGTERYSTLTGVFEVTLYSLFTLPVFVLFLTIAISNYDVIKLGNARARLLLYIFLILSGTQFFFVGDLQEFFLAAMSFGVVLALGSLLYSNSQREMRMRVQIQAQEEALENINKQQEGLLRFISHEVKGYLTKGQAAFAGIAQGDYGAITPELQHMADNAIVDARKGVDMVADILDASNLRKGTVSYVKAPFDFKKSVEQVIQDLTPSAEAKKIALSFSAASGSYVMEGDEAKIRRHVIRNLIDNALHYTPNGEIRVSLSRSDNHLRFSVKDTGVGITKEDMQRLFTEGGHGKESTKVNIDSTGYGLFIAKQITEVHGGTIQALSQGAGQGSEFVVELPM